MSKEYDLPSDSDDDDEDYIPKGVDSEAGSELESDGEVESSPEDDNDENLKDSEIGRKTGTKRGGKRKTSKSKKRKKLETVQDEIAREDSKEMEDKKHLTEEEEKKRADSLWADFMKDTSAVSSQKSTNTTNSTNSTHIIKETPLPVTKPASTGKVKITKLFEFAGEEIRVEKEVPVDCAEARLNLPSTDSRSESTPSSKGGGSERGYRKGGLGGIASVLGQLGKKTKISTLEKSKLDWDSYKREENIGEEISTHNKGKDGYLEKQDFLQRADLRQFEIEKQLRSTRRSTR